MKFDSSCVLAGLVCKSRVWLDLSRLMVTESSWCRCSYLGHFSSRLAQACPLCRGRGARAGGETNNFYISLFIKPANIPLAKASFVSPPCCRRFLTLCHRLPKDVPVQIPRACDYVMLRGEGELIADGIKITNVVTLRWEDYTESCNGRSNHSVLINERGKQKSGSQKQRDMRMPCCLLA